VPWNKSSNSKQVRIRVIYADTDAMGIVYHTNYIRWFEIGRTEYFRDLGVSHLNLPLTQSYCHYYLPARYDDLVVLETEIDFIKRASIKFAYRIWDEGHVNLLTDGYSVHACTDENGRVVRIPLNIAEKLKKHEPQF
jgi:acyl-CoA thioester hydrolase